MSIKSKLRMIGIFAALAMIGAETTREHREPKESEEERKRRLAKAEIERYKAKGLTDFFYGKNSLWALNKNSADKKARNRNWI